MVEISNSRSPVKSCSVFRLLPKTMIDTRSLDVICVFRKRVAASKARNCSAGCIDEKSNSITMSRWSCSVWDVIRGGGGASLGGVAATCAAGRSFNAGVSTGAKTSPPMRCGSQAISVCGFPSS